MAQAQGLESHKFKSTWACSRDIIASGGLRALYNGIGPRVARVAIEVGLQVCVAIPLMSSSYVLPSH